MNTKAASELHKDVPPDWYHRSIKENALQRFWHKKRIENVKKMIEPVKDKVLDIGSADGMFTEVITEKSGAKKVIGIDVLELSIDWSNKYYKKNKKMEFKKGDVHKLDFPENEFDAVFALEVLEHVFDPTKALKEIKRVLKKGGYAVLLVPAENWLFEIVWFLWHFSGRMVWKHTHLHKYSNSKLTHLCKEVGFKIEKDEKFLLDMLHLLKVRKTK